MIPRLAAIGFAIAAALAGFAAGVMVGESRPDHFTKLIADAGPSWVKHNQECLDSNGYGAYGPLMEMSLRDFCEVQTLYEIGNINALKAK
jgi:hypothetical protein